MKRFLAILLSILLAAAVPAAFAEEQTAGFSVPELYRTVSAQLNRELLPPDFPEETAVITAASFSGASLSVELNIPVPSLAVTQYASSGKDVVVRAAGENTTALSADNMDASQGMAIVTMTTKLSEGTLTGDWIVWEDNNFDFIQCQYTAEVQGDQFAPYNRETRLIELDQQGQVLNDTHMLSNESDSFTLILEYDASGRLADCSCEWAQDAGGTLFSVRSSADQVLSAMSWHTKGTDFTAVSDSLSDYLAGNSRVLAAIDYNDDYLSALRKAYPLLPEPQEDYPIDTVAATPTDLTAADLRGTLWCLGFGPEDSRTWVPFVTEDPLFLIRDGAVSLNAGAKDSNGAEPDFASRIPELPAFGLPALQ